MTYHGPSTEAWLRKHGVTDIELTETQQRRLRDWRSGVGASEEVLDEILTRCGHLTLHDIPLAVRYGHHGYDGLERVEGPRPYWVREAA